MKQIADGVYFVPGQDELIPDSHAYVLGKAFTSDLSLIDGGLMGKGAYKVRSIKNLGIKLSHIKRVIMTHTHLDHIGCLHEIRKEIPHAELWVHANEAKPLEQGDERCVYGMEMFKGMCQVQYGLEPGAFSLRVDRKLEGGEDLEIGGMAWEVLYIPGHSPGSVGLYNRERKILIPGDVVYADYAIGRFDLHGASGAQHRDSLMRLAALEVDILLPGHNRVVEGLPQDYILKTARQWEPYLS
jgi:hydroxyacylglutathione hydrolase